MKKFLLMIALGLIISACGNNNCPTSGVNYSNQSCPGYVGAAPSPNYPYGNNNGSYYGAGYGAYPTSGYPQGYPQSGQYPYGQYPSGYATGYGAYYR